MRKADNFPSRLSFEGKPVGGVECSGTSN